MRNVRSLLLEEPLVFHKDLSKHKTLLFSNPAFCAQPILLYQYLSFPKGSCTCIKIKEKKIMKKQRREHATQIAPHYS